jgi:hypothetical protein
MMRQGEVKLVKQELLTKADYLRYNLELALVFVYLFVGGDDQAMLAFVFVDFRNQAMLAFIFIYFAGFAVGGGAVRAGSNGEGRQERKTTKRAQGKFPFSQFHFINLSNVTIF